MTKYPDSSCELHRNVDTSEPVCIICMGHNEDRLRREINALKQQMQAAGVPFNDSPALMLARLIDWYQNAARIAQGLEARVAELEARLNPA